MPSALTETMAPSSSTRLWILRSTTFMNLSSKLRYIPCKEKKNTVTMCIRNLKHDIRVINYLADVLNPCRIQINLMGEYLEEVI